MAMNRQITRRLHEEHEATLALWSRLEVSLAANKTDQALLREAVAGLGHELARHFAFEENELFPRLAESGEADIGELLAEEHDAIRAAGRQFVALTRENHSDARLRPLGLELAERLASHVQKEEMSLLPFLDDLLDDDTDLQLVSAYANT